jgi:hypothetical protein
MALAQRLRQIEKKLKPPPESPKEQPMRLRDIPKETIVGAFAVLRDVGGYELGLGAYYRQQASEEEIAALNQLSPGEFYDMMFCEDDGSEIRKTT